MNFKTPFKVLTTAALIGTLSLSAVAPGVASAADKTVTAQAETPANFALEKVILVKGDSKISVSFDTYIDVLGNEKALNGYELAYVVAANGEVFALDTYVDFYEAGNTEEEVVEKLSKAGKTSEVTEVKDGAFNDGKLEPVEPAVIDPKVESVTAITSKTVEVSFPALAEAKTGVIVELKDNKGNVVEVVAQDLAKGATSAQFDFKAEYKGDLEGVWSIGDAKFSFDELKQIAAISEAADEIKLEAALEAAGIENVNEDLIAEYFDALHGEEFASLADVQKAVDEVNKANEEATTETAVVKAVVDATSQKALLTALEANFDRVNADWIKNYADTLVIDANGDGIKDTGDFTLLELTKDNVPNGFDKAAIQALVDDTNEALIDAANTAAKTETTQKEVTGLIQKWVKADEGKATAKKDAVAKSTAFELAFKVAESTNKGSLYNNLIKYANEVKDAGFKASDVLNVNQAAYLTKLVGTTSPQVAGENDAIIAAVAADKTNDTSTTAPIVKTIITDVNDTELTTAVVDAEGLIAAAVALNAEETTDTVKAFKDALTDVAAKSANLEAAAKLDLSKIDADLTVEYATAIATHDGAADAADDLSEVLAAIKSVNDEKDLLKAVAVVADSASTVKQVQAALVTLALGKSNTTTDAFVEASTQKQLEIAQFIIDNRDKLAKGNDLTIASITDDGATGYDTTAIGKATADQEIKVAQFNAIGNLASATTTSATTKTALDTYANDEYKALEAADKLAVAKEINKLTKNTGTEQAPVQTELDFAGADAVTTLAQADKYIADAIAAVKAAQ